MNIESHNQSPSRPNRNVDLEEIMHAFVSKNPDLLEKKLSSEEIHEAADLIGDRTDGSDEELLRRALEARVAVRTSGKIPVPNNQDMVIGMAESIDEAKNMYRKDNETRDSI